MISGKTCFQYAPQYKHFSLTTTSLLNQKHRKERGLPLNPNASGTLTDSPDFSYLDGRITPLGQGQRRRILRDEEVKFKVIALSKEIDFAIERYKQLQIEEENQKRQIIDRKLKPKGMALLKSS